MSKFFLILLTFTLLACKNAQVNSTDDRLYQHIDSLITQVLNYEYNEDSFAKPVGFDSANNRPIHISHSTLPLNPEPIILLDGYPTPKEDLKKLSNNLIKEIELMNPSDTTAALFGARGSNGAIIIKTTKFKRKKNNDK